MAEPTLADVLARLEKLEKRIEEIAAHEQDHHHSGDEHDHEHEHDHDHDHHHKHHGCAYGFDERRVVDLIVDLVEQRFRRVLSSHHGHGRHHGHGHGGH